MFEPVSSKDLLGTFGVNGKLFLAQLVNFSIILVVMWRWVYRPLVAMMEKRATEISDGLAHAKEATRTLEDAEEVRKKMLRETKIAAHVTIEDAKKKAEDVRKEKLMLATQEVEKLVKDAHVRIQHDRDDAFAALRNDVARLIADATTKVAGKMDEKAQRALIADAINEL